jgi:hypothetical protein
MSCGTKNDIPLYVDSSNDWVKPNSNYHPYAVDLSAGVNEYMFGRTTPDNNFIVSTGLIKDNSGIEMVGGSKKKLIKKTKTVKPKVTKSSTTVKKTKTLKPKVTITKSPKPVKKTKTIKPKVIKSSTTVKKTETIKKTKTVKPKLSKSSKTVKPKLSKSSNNK